MILYCAQLDMIILAMVKGIQIGHTHKATVDFNIEPLINVESLELFNWEYIGTI
jgi:hypothetical protein